VDETAAMDYSPYDDWGSHPFLEIVQNCLMKLKMLLPALLACFITASGQSLHFCSSYLPDGSPEGESNEWNMYSSGGNVYLLFRQPDDIPTEGLKFLVEFQEGDEFIYSSSSTVEPKAGARWIVLDHHFSEKGSYKVSVKKDSEVLASAELSLSFLRPGTDYSESSMNFCSSVESGKPVDTLTTLQLLSGAVKARAFVYNPDNLNCSRLVVDIWKHNGTAFREYVATKKYEVQPGWLFTQFSYELKEEGRYRFMVYSDSGVWINSAEIEVKAE
jgi:hypothetical protein